MLNLGPYSTKEFPNIRVYPTVIDRILEGVAVLLAVAAWGVLYGCIHMQKIRL